MKAFDYSLITVTVFMRLTVSRVMPGHGIRRSSEVIGARITI